MRTFDFIGSPAAAAEIGARIKRLRLRANLTQQQLAGMTGASLSSVRRLESSGQGTLELVLRMAQALHVMDQFEQLFIEPALSIAEVERNAVLMQRQRARTATRRPNVRAAP